MVTRAVLELVQRRLTRLLTVAEAAMPPPQFKAFRKIALDEFGWEGLQGELAELERQGSEGSQRNVGGLTYVGTGSGRQTQAKIWRSPCGAKQKQPPA